MKKGRILGELFDMKVSVVLLDYKFTDDGSVHTETYKVYEILPDLNVVVRMEAMEYCETNGLIFVDIRVSREEVIQ